MQSTYEESRLLWSSRVEAFKASGLTHYNENEFEVFIGNSSIFGKFLWVETILYYLLKNKDTKPRI